MKALVAALASLIALTVSAQDDFAAAARCAGLRAGVDIDDLVITSAEWSETLTLATPSGARTEATGGHCHVEGAIRGNIRFALLLPDAWNGRFQMLGNGGKAGSILYDRMLPELTSGYAVANTDTGHDNNAAPPQHGALFGNDAVFGAGREIDFGWRAVHLTATSAKEIVARYYGAPAQYAYWNGCSTGGRQGLMEAQRFPEDFDGYVIGAPVYPYTQIQMNAPAFMRAMYAGDPLSSEPALSASKLEMIGKVVYAGYGEFSGCDLLDGLADGQLRDPRECHFDPAQHIPACPNTNDPDVCLTPPELKALQALYAGVPPYVPGMIMGAENTPGGWGQWLLTPAPGRPPALHNVIGDSFKWLLFAPDRPDFDYLRDFDFAVHPAQMQQAVARFSAGDPDLDRLRAGGGKIILYHGWADAGPQPQHTLDYYQHVRDRLQAESGDAAEGQRLTDQFLKMYLVPGMAHCGGGSGHSEIDWLLPLAVWVEQERPPYMIVGRRDASTRPHCPYPEVAIHDGRGDPDDAASFHCGR